MLSCPERSDPQLCSWFFMGQHFQGWWIHGIKLPLDKPGVKWTEKWTPTRSKYLFFEYHALFYSSKQAFRQVDFTHVHVTSGFPAQWTFNTMTDLWEITDQPEFQWRGHWVYSPPLADTHKPYYSLLFKSDWARGGKLRPKWYNFFLHSLGLACQRLCLTRLSQKPQWVGSRHATGGQRRELAPWQTEMSSEWLLGPCVLECIGFFNRQTLYDSSSGWGTVG